MPINFTNDITSLKHDLDKFSISCLLNGMSLNTSKCVCISFNSSKSHINFQYFISGISLNYVNHVQDLGIILSANLSFNAH